MRIKLDVELQEVDMRNLAHVQQVLNSFPEGVETHLVTDKEALARLVNNALTKRNFEPIIREFTERLCHNKLYEDTLDVLCGAIFSSQRVERGDPLDGFIALLSQLPEATQATAKRDIVQRAMTFLSTPRRLDCSRITLLPYAEVIAALTKAEMLNVRSVVVALMQMIRLDITRSAGITCLGKMVEVAHELLLERLDQHTLDTLRSTVAFAQQDDTFLYDVEYIMEPFGWSQSQKFINFAVRRSGAHHSSAILALAYGGSTSSREAVVTSSVDGTIGTWDQYGVLAENLVLSRHYASSMDLANRGRTLIVGTVGRNPTVAPAIVLYSADSPYNEESNWQESCGAEPRGARFITTVRSLRSAGTLRYCCGVTTNTSNTMILYDATQVIQEYNDHNDIISAMHVIPDRDNTVVTGSRDCSVMVYDLRIPQNATTTSAHRHYSTVTSIGSCGDCLFTSGLDRRVVVHDLRMMGQGMATRELDSAVLSLSVNPNMVCAASTMTGIHLINFANNAMPTCRADGGRMSPRYNAIAWNAQGDVLYAGGDSNTLDMFTRSYPDAETYAS
ncbi:guanine nucleotide-binding protein beta subunit-like protein [Trypanosoma theileri]|uniref:Guanine nucleotide-binding protein beta subunit-like protein n=1 Tax=Trypanosoma theileri TaxID=67003 RepID=A0A1X0NIQ5_9TRYP|nr:guanine nucleotide-binding protein beta subunit-like protein [Trypanosoma theileri]ORC84615.1 guanine nucleotide-binding protein beta subunit-like protein [Trypanosoma theileri]